MWSPNHYNDFLYWNQLSQPTVIKAGSKPIDYVDFSPANNFAVTSDRIKVYNPMDPNRSSSLCESIRNAYGGTFNKDGQLFVCGDEDNSVKLCEMSSERNEWSMYSLIRQHTAPVHRTFFTANQSRIASFSDDKTVRLWDVSTGNCVETFEQVHNDIIRAGCVSPVSPSTIVSGGYDRKAKMLDTRSNSTVFEVDHGFPIQAVMFLQTGGILVSCGGSHVKIWDAIAGGRLWRTLETRDKDITCLRLACNGTRILSGGCDRKVNIYDRATCGLLFSLDFQFTICSMAVAPDDGTLVVGTTDGNIVVRNMDCDRKIKIPQRVIIPKMILSPDQNYILSPEDELMKMLDNGEYLEALRTLVSGYHTNVMEGATGGLHPAVDIMKSTKEEEEDTNVTLTFRRLYELVNRRQCMGRALRALKDQPNEFLEKFIPFLIEHVDDGSFVQIIIDTSNILLDVFGDKLLTLSGGVLMELMKLNIKLKSEDSTWTEFLKEFLELQGAVKLVLSGANVADKNLDTVQF